MTAEFQKGPTAVKAIRVLNTADSLREIDKFIGGRYEFELEFDISDDDFVIPEKLSGVLILTSEGVMRADVGDWIIEDTKGEFHPCKPDIIEWCVSNDIGGDTLREAWAECCSEKRSQQTDSAFPDSSAHPNEMLRWAEELIRRAIELMSLEQIGEWEGVRAWQETVGESHTE